MFEISVPGWIWCFALDCWPLYVCQKLKDVLPVYALVRVAVLVISGYHITAPVLLLSFIRVMGHSYW